ncbi:MAG: hypothetical protein P4M11_13620 [Candidatus Pacebacteria bacterium]|nr:hypothetical protein [Candidatus Paceibacterota bacterium]
MKRDNARNLRPWAELEGTAQTAPLCDPGMRVEIVPRKRESEDLSSPKAKDRTPSRSTAAAYRKMMLESRQRSRSVGINSRRRRLALRVVGTKGLRKEISANPVRRSTRRKESKLTFNRTTINNLKLMKTDKRNRLSDASRNTPYGDKIANTTIFRKCIRFVLSGKQKPLQLSGQGRNTAKPQMVQTQTQIQSQQYSKGSRKDRTPAFRRLNTEVDPEPRTLSPEPKRRSVFSRGFLRQAADFLRERSNTAVDGYFGDS